jgi:hypothetical protein
MIYEFAHEVLLVHRLYNKEHKELYDYAADSFENPQIALRVFASMGDEFIRFSSAG